MARVISVINYKGGVGKTTVTLQLAAGLVSKHKKKVLMVDLDPQCSLSLSTVDEYYWADWLERKGSVMNVLQAFFDDGQPEIDPDWIIENALDRSWDAMPGNTPGLDLLPSHLDLPEYEMRLVGRKPRSMANMEEFHERRTTILRDALKNIRKKYDYVLFDCPPNIYLISGNAILASDYFLVPTIPDFISCYGIPFILQHIENMLAEARDRGLRVKAEFLGIVRNRVRQAGSNIAKEHQDQSQKLGDRYGDLLFETMIMDRIGVAELLGTRKNIYEDSTEKLSEIRSDFTSLVDEMLRRIES